MQVEFELSFLKDLKAISRDGILNKRILTCIQELESCESLSEVKSVKHLAGPHYRIRIGDYRMCFATDGISIRLTYIRHRKDVYRVFPPK